MLARKLSLCTGAVFFSALLLSFSVHADSSCAVSQFPSLTQQQVRDAVSVSQGSDLLVQEKNYYQLTQRQLLSDALLLYSSKTPQIVYAEFNQDQSSFDLGYGLHIVKRLDLGEKTIFVNEAWPYIRGKLQLPTEIRIRTRIFYEPGDPRGIYHGEDQYLMGRFRIGWGQQDEALVFVETGWLNAKERAQRRVPVSIFNCTSCHLSGNPFAVKYRTSGNDPINHEAIVQPDYFAAPIQGNRGYSELLKYLVQQHVPQTQIDAMKAAIDRPIDSFHSRKFADAMSAALCEKISSDSIEDLPEDEQFVGDLSGLQPAERQDGIYGERKLLWRDSVDQILEDRFGKYFRWIDNQGTVPGY